MVIVGKEAGVGGSAKGVRYVEGASFPMLRFSDSISQTLFERISQWRTLCKGGHCVDEVPRGDETGTTAVVLMPPL